MEFSSEGRLDGAATGFDGRRDPGRQQGTTMDAAVESLLGNLEKSGLLGAEQLSEARAVAEEAASPVVLGRNLVARGLLTRWQATQLLGGRNLTSFVLGKYKLLELLGRGGMGNVYLAQHVAMNRRVALKLLSRTLDRDPVARERFFEEARVAASLDHPNIVRAYSIDSANERHFIVMEYVDGRDLQRIVEEDGPLSYSAAVDVIRQAADGLAYAHGRNMIHCDIKPANLLRNSQGVVKILDLGLARLTHDTDGKASGDEQELGTVDYMSPEQALGVSFDHRTDIYSLGCTLYFLLTGRPPFPEGTLHERIVKHQVEQPRSILELRPSTPRGLARICRKMMAKYPAERFQTAAEVAQALGELDLQPSLRRAVPLDDNGQPIEDRPVGASSATLRAIPSHKPGASFVVQAMVIGGTVLAVIALAVAGSIAVMALMRSSSGKPAGEAGPGSPHHAAAPGNPNAPAGEADARSANAGVPAAAAPTTATPATTTTSAAHASHPAAAGSGFELPDRDQRWKDLDMPDDAGTTKDGSAEASPSQKSGSSGKGTKKRPSSP